MLHLTTATEDGDLSNAVPLTGAMLMSSLDHATVVVGVQGQAKAGNRHSELGRYGVAVAGPWGEAFTRAEGVAVAGGLGTALAGAESVAVVLQPILARSEAAGDQRGRAHGADGAVAICFGGGDADIDGLGIAYGKPGARVAGGPGSLLILDTGDSAFGRYIVERVADPGRGIRGLKPRTWYTYAPRGGGYVFVEQGPVT
ncbi:hypothetical protein AAFN86_10905 [Roseomonas sp. CAU 1739]|uniref:hypothetical protein n=1 Tax=Roseomonas sp. CAU 1739 TaxID=3140364 RepID=UPI00325A6AAD